MIQTVTVDLINDKALKLLQDLESMQLIRLHPEKTQPNTKNSVARYKGAWTKQPITDIGNQLDELRNGWD